MDDYGKVQKISKKEEININIIQNKNCIGLFVQETKMHRQRREIMINKTRQRAMCLPEGVEESGGILF